MNVFLLPSRNLAITIPVVLTAGFLAGLYYDTGFLKNYILPVTVLMIYPTMIGFNLRDVISLSHARLLMVATLVNFILVPALAYFLGVLFLINDPELFAGLVIASLLPTSNMTIAFTHFAGGNVTAAIKLTALSLIAGSLLAPWYLLVMVGGYIPVDIWATLKVLTIVIFLPLFMGSATFGLILRKYTREEFNHRIKPILPAVTAWGMVYMIFTGVSINSNTMVSRPDLLYTALMVWVVFYLINYTLAVKLGRLYFNRADSLVLVFGTVLRNLAISVGFATVAFGFKAALMVSLAFLFQGPSAALFMRLNQKIEIFQPSPASGHIKEELK